MNFHFHGIQRKGTLQAKSIGWCLVSDTLCAYVLHSLWSMILTWRMADYVMESHVKVHKLPSLLHIITKIVILHQTAVWGQKQPSSH